MMQILKRGFTLTQGGYEERGVAAKRESTSKRSLSYIWEVGHETNIKSNVCGIYVWSPPPQNPPPKKIICQLSAKKNLICQLSAKKHLSQYISSGQPLSQCIWSANCVPNKSKKPEQKKTKQKKQRKLTHQRPRNQNQNQKKQNQKKTKPKKNKENWLIRDPQTKTKQVYKTESYRYTKQSRIVIPSVIKQTGPGPSF